MAAWDVFTKAVCVIGITAAMIALLTIIGSMASMRAISYFKRLF